MSIQVVTQVGNSVPLTNSVRTQYVEAYLDGLHQRRLYDQLATPIARNMDEISHGTSVQVPFLSDMAVGTTAISEIADVVPQALRDASASVTPTSRGEALQGSEKLLLTVFTDYQRQYAERVGFNAMETIDSLARDAATQGNLVHRDAATRATLDAGSTSNRADDQAFMKVSGMLQSLKVPGFVDPAGGTMNWAAIMHPHVYHDILRSGNVVSIGQYQKASILLDHELGMLGPFRLVSSPWAKVFYGAGAANAKAVATELKGDGAGGTIPALSKVVTVSVTSSLEQGKYLNVIETLESGNTHVSNNERVVYVSDTAKVMTFVGEGANGGFRFDHTGGTTTLTNNDSAYSVVFGGPQSLVKVFSPSIGEFGQIVGPKRDGVLEQFYTLGWKFYGGYGRIRENGLVRGEFSVSYEA